MGTTKQQPTPEEVGESHTTTTKEAVDILEVEDLEGPPDLQTVASWTKLVENLHTNAWIKLLPHGIEQDADM